MHALNSNPTRPQEQENTKHSEGERERESERSVWFLIAIFVSLAGLDSAQTEILTLLVYLALTNVLCSTSCLETYAAILR